MRSRCGGIASAPDQRADHHQARRPPRSRATRRPRASRRRSRPGRRPPPGRRARPGAPVNSCRATAPPARSSRARLGQDGRPAVAVQRAEQGVGDDHGGGLVRQPGGVRPGRRPPRARRPPNSLVRRPAASASGSTPTQSRGPRGEDRVGREAEPGGQLDDAVALLEPARRRARAPAWPGRPAGRDPATARRASGHGVTARSACAVVVIVLPRGRPWSAAMRSSPTGRIQVRDRREGGGPDAPAAAALGPGRQAPAGRRPPRPAPPPCDRG